MTEDRIYNSPLDLEKSGFPIHEYQGYGSAGMHVATVDAKLWGTGRIDGSLISYCTLEDGDKIQVWSWFDKGYRGMDEIAVGSSVLLTLEENSKGRITLREAVVLDER